MPLCLKRIEYDLKGRENNPLIEKSLIFRATSISGFIKTGCIEIANCKNKKKFPGWVDEIVHTKCNNWQQNYIES